MTESDGSQTYKLHKTFLPTAYMLDPNDNKLKIVHTLIENNEYVYRDSNENEVDVVPVNQKHIFTVATRDLYPSILTSSILFKDLDRIDVDETLNITDKYHKKYLLFLNVIEDMKDIGLVEKLLLGSYAGLLIQNPPTPGQVRLMSIYQEEWNIRQYLDDMKTGYR